MRQERIMLTGVSGVGKSFMLANIRKTHDFQQLSASELIATANSMAVSDPSLGEKLRIAKIEENQVNLITGFRQACDPSAQCVVLDGHTLIDTPKGFVFIGPDVFAEIGISLMVNLVDDARQIFLRRNNDKGRTRPERSESEISEYQEAAQMQCARIAIALKIPLISIPIGLSEYFESIFPKVQGK